MYADRYISIVQDTIRRAWEEQPEVIGKTAAERLIHRIEHPEDAAPEQIVISGELMEGSTVQDINK